MTQFLSYMQIAALVRNLYYIDEYFRYRHAQGSRVARFFRRRLP